MAELINLRVPFIAVPLPSSIDNHQFKNAQSLVNKKAALIVEDIEANRKLVDTILKLVNDEGLQKKISKNIKKLEIKDASVKIAVDSVKKIITTSVDKSKLDNLFQKNLEETKEELKKINS